MQHQLVGDAQQLSKPELLAWISAPLGRPVASLDDLRSGSIFLEALAGGIHPGFRAVDADAVVVSPATKREVLKNYQLLAQSLPGQAGVAELCGAGR